MAPRSEVTQAVVARIGEICRLLPEVVEEPAWVGTRWRIRSHTFAHVLAIEDGWPPVYAKVTGTAGPAVVLTFRSAGDELEALGAMGHPYFRANFGRDDAGIFIESGTDWDEVSELVTESYCLLAPKRLVALVRPVDP